MKQISNKELLRLVSQMNQEETHYFVNQLVYLGLIKAPKHIKRSKFSAKEIEALSKLNCVLVLK